MRTIINAVLRALTRVWLALPDPVQRAITAVWKAILANWQELFGLPVAVVLFIMSGPALRMLEPSSAIYDAGVLQSTVVGMVHLLVGNSVARFATRVNLSWFYEREEEAKRNERTWLFIAYLAAYCWLVSGL